MSPFELEDFGNDEDFLQRCNLPIKMEEMVKLLFPSFNIFDQDCHWVGDNIIFSFFFDLILKFTLD